jgi:hypothetical protein
VGGCVTRTVNNHQEEVASLKAGRAGSGMSGARQQPQQQALENGWRGELQGAGDPGIDLVSDSESEDSEDVSGSDQVCGHVY